MPSPTKQALLQPPAFGGTSQRDSASAWEQGQAPATLLTVLANRFMIVATFKAVEAIFHFHV